MPTYLCTLQSGALLLVAAKDENQLFQALSKFDDPTQCGVREFAGPLAIDVEPTFKGHCRHSSKRFKSSHGDAPLAVLATNLWRQRIFTDFTLTAKDGACEAVHRCILMAACPHLGEEMKKLSADKMSINAHSREVLSAFVRYLYTAEIPELEVEESWQLLELAGECQLPDLARMCEASIAEFYESFCLDTSDAHWAVPTQAELRSAQEAADYTLSQAIRARSLNKDDLADFFLWNAARHGWKVLIACPTITSLPQHCLDYLMQVVASAFPPVVRRWTLGVAQIVCSDEYERAGGELTSEESAALKEWRSLSSQPSTPSAVPQPFTLDENCLQATLLDSHTCGAVQLGRVRLCGHGGEEVLVSAVFPALAKQLPKSKQMLHQASDAKELQACNDCRSRLSQTTITDECSLSLPSSIPCASDPSSCTLCRLVSDAKAALTSDLSLVHQASLEGKAIEAEAMALAERGDLRSEVMLRANIMAPVYSLTQQRSAIPDKDSNESENSGFSDDSDDDDDDDDDDMVVDMDSNEWLQGFVIKGVQESSAGRRKDSRAVEETENDLDRNDSDISW